MVLFLVLAGTLLLFAQHLPAPVVEDTTPTPAAEHSAKPKLKRTSKPKNESESSRSSVKRQVFPPSSIPQKRFAGTWSGSVSNNSLVWAGEHQMTFIINSAENLVKVEPRAGAGAAIISGNTISWKSTWYWNPWHWTLTLGADGRTANVAANFADGGSASGVVTRR